MPDYEVSDRFEHVTRGENGVLFVHADLDGVSGSDQRLIEIASAILAEELNPDITIDIRGRFVNETGVKSLLMVASRARDAGREVFLSPNEQAIKKLAMCGVLEYFNIRPAA